ncbi:uncharacterized protein ARMOST_19519 [Armillaria ostoyae]|uniref:Uncharacterized protein n=1 Tax=Armillaria ostoyae TaxID=47428 RepID=A0A284S4U3_ARMOS|nr:uncharacterized protein ARMOST_19519 [Armillaria ostoyae]
MFPTYGSLAATSSPNRIFPSFWALYIHPQSVKGNIHHVRNRPAFLNDLDMASFFLNYYETNYKPVIICLFLH